MFFDPDLEKWAEEKPQEVVFHLEAYGWLKTSDVPQVWKNNQYPEFKNSYYPTILGALQEQVRFEKRRKIQRSIAKSDLPITQANAYKSIAKSFARMANALESLKMNGY